MFTVKEHYVPRCYLKNFENDKGVISALQLSSLKWKTIGPASFCWEKDLYETIDDSKNFIGRNILESYFCDLEGAFSALSRKIINRCKINNSDAAILSTEEKQILAKFVSVQYLRHPEIKKQHSEMIAECLGRELNSVEIGASYTQHALLGDGQDLHRPLADIFSQTIIKACSFSFLIPNSTTKHFFTSDFPVWADTYADATVKRNYYFPLSPDVAIYIGIRTATEILHRNHIVVIDESEVDRFNAFEVQNAPCWVMGRDLSCAEKQFVEKHIKKLENETESPSNGS